MAAIAYWCATRHVPALQQQIKVNAEAAVASVTASNVAANVQGRTVTLKGSVANDDEKTELLVALNAADGVRHIIDDQLTVIDGVAAVTDTNNTITNQPSTTAEPVDKPASNEQTSQPTNLAVVSPIDDIAKAASAKAASERSLTPQTPAPEAPTPEAPAPEAPTPEALAPEVPTPEAPAPEAPTPEAPAPEAPAPEAPTPEALAPEVPTPEAPAPEAPTPEVPNSNSATGVATATPTDNIQPEVEDLAELAVGNDSAAISSPDSPSPEVEDSSPAFVDALDAEVEDASPAFVDALDAETSSFSMQVKDDTLTLTGDITAEGDSLSFIQSAMKTFDVNYVVNSMQVNEENDSANWLPALTKFIPSMQPLSDARISISESQITLYGIAPSKQARDNTIDNALSLLSNLSLVDRITLSSDNTTSEALEPATTPSSEPASTTAQNTTQPGSQADPEAPATTQAQLSTLREAFSALAAERILFRSGSNVLTEQSVQTVAAMSALVSKYSDINIEIDGHTDSLGSPENNLRLSQLRANAVRDLMIQRGIARERLSAYGFGDGVPIADNGTEAGRKLNRRIEFNF